MTNPNPEQVAHMVNSPTFQVAEFCPENDQWVLYHERLENFFDSYRIEDPVRKRVLLLNAIGAKPYKLIRDLCTPDAPTTKTYEQLCELMKSYYTPPEVVYKQRKMFYAAAKSSEESVVQWMVHIKFLAAACNFGNTIDSRILDKFVTSFDGRTFDRLSEEDPDTLTLTKATEIAVRCESRAEVSVNAVHTRQPHHSKKATWPPKSQQGGGHSTGGGPDRARCKHCGFKNHTSSECRFKDASCHKCRQKGHLASICRKSSVNHVSEQSFTMLNNTEHVGSIYSISTNFDNTICAQVQVNNIAHEFLLDSGASISAIPLHTYTNKFQNFKLSESNLTLHAYSGHNIVVAGQFSPVITFNNKQHKLKLMVVGSDGPSILGRDFLRCFGISFAEINQIKSQPQNPINQSLSLESVLKKYPKVFEQTIGKYVYKQVHLSINSDAKPVFCKPRQVPHAFKAQVEAELERLERLNVITPVETSEWGTPLVPILKSNGQIRICADYKVTINRYLNENRHPLPRVEEIFNALRGGCSFSKLDLESAYNQIELDESSRHLAAWSTHKGVYLVNRLPFGVKPATGIFQAELEKLLQGIPGVVNFLDDIVVTGISKEAHLSNLSCVFQRLSDAGLKLRKEKCDFFKDDIIFLGHRLNREGLSKTDERTKSVVDKPSPKDVTEVRAFTGLVNYYAKFIQNSAQIMYPMYRLLQKDVKFIWDKKCEQSFQQIKDEIMKNVVLSHFNDKLPIILSCDASQHGLGAVLSHKLSNGDEKPVAFCSRTLSPAESNYSVIDKEALAIVYACNKFYHYLIGVHFTLKTDHKPLVRLFGETSGIPQMAASRIQRWANFLSGFDYEIQYVKGGENNADAFSRLPIKQNENKIETAEHNYLNFVSDRGVSIDYKTIRAETAKDPILSKVLAAINTGNLTLLNDEHFQPFTRRSTELSIEYGIVMWGYRVVIPKKCRQTLISSIHSTHMGIVKTKAIARSFMWWPGIDADLETAIKSCKSCLSVRPNPQKAGLIPWELPERVWSRIHVDYAGPIKNNYFLIVTDAFSKWPEVFRTVDITSKFTVNKLREVFARFGLPDTIVSDNGTQFTSEMFKDFMNQNRIRHITTAPAHPATNGAAENCVRSFKNGLAAAVADNTITDIDILIQRYLFDYRIAPHCTTFESPAKLLFGRTIKTRFDLVKPPLVSDVVQNNQAKQIQNFKGRRDVTFIVGEKVSIRDLTNPIPNKTKWMPATIDTVLGSRTYLCTLPNAKQVKRHTNQIHKTTTMDSEHAGDVGSFSIPQVKLPPAVPLCPVYTNHNLHTQNQTSNIANVKNNSNVSDNVPNTNHMHNNSNNTNANVKNNSNVSDNVSNTNHIHNNTNNTNNNDIINSNTHSGNSDNDINYDLIENLPNVVVEADIHQENPTSPIVNTSENPKQVQGNQGSVHTPRPKRISKCPNRMNL